MDPRGLLELVQKRDDDARFIQIVDKDTGNSDYIIESTENVNDIIPGSVEVIDDDYDDDGDDGMNGDDIYLGEHLLEDAASQRNEDIPVRAAYLIFLVVAAINFSSMLISVLPYWLLFVDETRVVSIYVLSFSLVLACIAYICTLVLYIVFKNLRAAIVVIMIGLLCGTIFVGALSAIIQNISPIQFISIAFSQSIMVILHTRVSRYMIVPMTAAIYMLIATILIWIVGVYAYVNQRDWIAAIILFAASIGLLTYNIFQLRAVESRQYNISQKSRLTAIIRYWIDPLLLLLSLLQICNCFTKKKEEEEEEEEENKNLG